MENPGLMRFGMFVTATFHGLTTEKHATVGDTGEARGESVNIES